MTLLAGYATTGLNDVTSLSVSTNIGFYAPVAAVTAGIATSIKFYYITGGSVANFQFTIIKGAGSDNAGGGSAVAHTASTAVSGLTANNWNTISLLTNPNILTDGSLYTIAVQADASAYLSVTSGIGYNIYTTGGSYGTTPTTLASGGGHIYTGATSVYVDGTVGPTYYPQSRRRRIFLPAFYPG